MNATTIGAPRICPFDETPLTFTVQDGVARRAHCSRCGYVVRPDASRGGLWTREDPDPLRGWRYWVLAVPFTIALAFVIAYLHARFGLP